MKTALLLFVGVLVASAAPTVYPPPREVRQQAGNFRLDESIPVLVPRNASEEDLRLARSLMAELSDRWGVGAKMNRVSALPSGGKFVLMGSIANPLVKQYCQRRGLHVDAKTPGPEGYVLDIDGNAAVVAGSDAPGAFYGLQSLRQLIQAANQELQLPGVRMRDWPYKPFRGIKLYLPGHENIAYFKRFVRDVMALYKYNKMLLELNAGMRFERHPELNAGWIEFGKDLNYTRRDRSLGPGRQYQDSANADTADSGVLEKDEVADLVRFARENHIEVIPEIPTLTHSYYLLTRHRELAEIADAEWPDTYCPSEPKVYDLVFDVLDEFIDVMKPAMVHVGHDEWRMPLGACPRCRGKDPTELFAQDLNKIYSHLQQKGVRTAIWGDHLIEPLRGKRSRKVPNPKGTPYEMPGALSPEQVKKLIPKDILIFNWFWDDGKEGLGEENDIALQKWGFQQVYGNFRPDIQNFDRRSAMSGVIGGAPSSWAATNEFNFGKDLMFDFLGCANLLWSTARPSQSQLSETIQRLLPGVRRNLTANPFPSDNGPVTPVDLGASARAVIPDIDISLLKKGRIAEGKNIFELTGRAISSATEAQSVRIGEDVSSLIFLHASARPAGNIPAYSGTWNFADTADLLGWYETVYEDGLVETTPVRYGVNILEAGWGKSHIAKSLAYGADLVDCARPGSERITLFAYEWINPRFGKVIREVRLKRAFGFQDSKGKLISENPIILAAISVVKKRVAPDPKPLKIIYRLEIPE